MSQPKLQNAGTVGQRQGNIETWKSRFAGIHKFVLKYGITEL